MITGELRSRVDRVWDAFWTGGISNPLEVIEQITYLLFLRRLDIEQTRKDKQARINGGRIVEPIYEPSQRRLRWSSFKNEEPETMFVTVSDEVFPFLRAAGGDSTTYSTHMRNARFTIPTPALLARVVDMIDKLELDDRDTSGDLYEYLLSKIATAGMNGQFRTPRHIIELMVEMTAPTPDDVICDPACGTAGFLVAAAQHVRDKNPGMMANSAQREHFHHDMFHGYDFDSTMLRVGSMNMLQHGVDAPDIRYRDSLSEGVSGDAAKYTLILANPPFSGSLDYDSTSKNLQRTVKTRKTELLFLALFLKLLEPGGRAAVIVPDGVLTGSSKAHKDIRRVLVEEHKLDAVVKLPSGVFKPYSGVSTAILFFTRTDSGGTENVWFYDVRADGFSLDDKRNPVEANDLSHVRKCWDARAEEVIDDDRAGKCFLVPKIDIASQGYDLSFRRYWEPVTDSVVHRSPLDIIVEVEKLEKELSTELADLKAMLS